MISGRDQLTYVEVARDHLNTVGLGFDVCNRIIDPSAGSPTETLLRLLLPLSDKVH